MLPYFLTKKPKNFRLRRKFEKSKRFFLISETEFYLQKPML